MYFVSQYIIISQTPKYTFINQAGLIVGWDNSVGMATSYGPEGQGIESR